MDTTTSNLAYRTARSHVYAFANEGDERLALRHEASEGSDCAAFLQLGIDAFHWLGRADTAIRTSVLRGEMEHDAAIDDSLRFLYGMWLRPVPFAERWAAEELARSGELENLDEFRQCCEEVRSLLGENEALSDELAALRDRAVESFRRGDTIEWETEESTDA
jgi:hypothetical protein